VPAVSADASPAATGPPVAIDSHPGRNAEHALRVALDVALVDAHPTRPEDRPERRSIPPVDPDVGKIGIGLRNEEVRRLPATRPDTDAVEVADLVQYAQDTSSGAIRTRS